MIFNTHENSGSGGGRSRRMTLAAVAVVGALAALAPATANAGTYQMYNCHVAGHETGTVGPWAYRVAYGSPNGRLQDGCAPPGGNWGYNFGPYFPGGISANS